jgi:hypothetical protein
VWSVHVGLLGRSLRAGLVFAAIGRAVEAVYSAFECLEVLDVLLIVLELLELLC